MVTGNFFDVLILFGSIQGFISAFLLFSKKKHISHSLLGMILIITSLACLNIYLLNVLSSELPFLLIVLEKVVPLIIIMPLGPLIFFYVRSFCGLPFQFRKEKWHFAPIILDLIPSLISVFYLILFLFDFSPSVEPAAIGTFKDQFDKYVDIPRWISTSVYLFMSAKFFFRANPLIKRPRWIKQFIWVFAVFQALWLFHLVPYLLPSTSTWLLGTLSWYPIYLPLTILVYWLGANGVIQSKAAKPVDSNNAQAMNDTLNFLNEIMQTEKLFLNPSLSLNVLVEKTGISQKTISASLNQYVGKSFNEYVNEFRVEEVKSKMQDPKYNHLSITGIALESGFNSQATFQRSFKSITTLTPKAFQAELKREANSAHS